MGTALPQRRCCAYITIGMICIFIGVGLTVSITLLIIRILPSQLYIKQTVRPEEPAFLAYQAQKLLKDCGQLEVQSMDLFLGELVSPEEMVSCDPSEGP